MGRFVNPNNSAFHQTALNSEIYVDKTGLIEYTNRILGSSQAYVCNSRPRRFGKSVTANMLAAYYSSGCDSSEMFQKLYIGKSKDYEKHLNQYDVIHFDVQWLVSQAENLDSCVSFIESVIVQELHEEFPKIVRNKLKLSTVLAEINKKTGRRFIIIIDEWDVLFRDQAKNVCIQEQYLDFIRSIFNGIEATRYIQLAYMTGIFPISVTKAQAILNTFNEFSMIDSKEFASYTGFTEEEVRFLCQKNNRDFEQVRQWYGGYQLNNDMVYNPIGIVNIMLWGNYRHYWAQTGTYETIVPIIKNWMNDNIWKLLNHGVLEISLNMLGRIV